MSYFAEPNFIVYDEWFDEDLEKPSQYVQNKKIKTFSNVHDFFYEQSNCNIGGSENNLQLDIKVTEKELITNNLENTSEKYAKLPNKLFWLFEKYTKSKIKIYNKKKLIYYLSIFVFIFIF